MIALLGFVFVGLFSPGPNVILLTTSGARFGFRPTLPHLLGVAAGVGVLAGAVGFGIGALLAAAPGLTLILKFVASGWILIMAWRLWHAEPPSVARGRARPFTFVEAALFQWVNPKVWAVALSAAAYVADLPPTDQALRLALAFSGVNLFVCLFWTGAGHLLRDLLAAPFAWRVFIRTMAVLLAVFSGLVFL